MKVLLVDNNDSFTYNLAQLIKQKGNCGLDIRKYKTLDIDEAGEFEKILFSPGPGLPREYKILGEIIRRFGDCRSILGVCLGHQAIAQYYGGQLFRQEQPMHGIRHIARLTDHQDYLFEGLPAEFEVGLYHSWAVAKEDFPAELKITAVSEKGIIMALTHKEHDIKGIQFHPESIMTGSGRKIIYNWLEKY